ncbi:DUF4190 domain-containing protein [Allobranchiibius sp. GilTou73]|uniref:DUF4190 domain-containing protein n=1 Tax=Allobranchiibius sp. GilTou73 TaxID=2904523 RepID=UPI001F427AD8|nr:DUF4190 domain-containing protein [Allobranchiibius sp. GilTou73]UIJ34474.1 DUF4190 domain-containing protein [Allobranchiibius sp. GilTou73]
MSYDQSAPPPPPGDYGQGGGFQGGGPGDGGYGGAPPQQSTKAVVALVLSILGVCCFIFPIAGIVLGVQSKKEIQNSGGRQKGAGLAQAAIIVGAILLVLAVIGDAIYFSRR